MPGKTFLCPYAQYAKSWTAVVITATPLTGPNSVADNTPANTVLLVKAGENDALLSSISAMPRSTLGATPLYLWTSIDNGSTKHLIASALLTGGPLSTTTEIPRVAFKHPDGTVISEFNPLRLQAGEELYCGIGVTVSPGGIVFSGRSSDF